MTIRSITADDMPGLKAVIEATGLFPADMLEGMIEPYFQGHTPELWLTVMEDAPQAIAYCAPERMTQGTWNLLLIAVHPLRQGQGIGRRLMHQVEEILREQGERVLLVETSGLPAFESTRAFYRALGYEEEACIRDFYQAGEDKIIFRKTLHAS